MGSSFTIGDRPKNRQSVKGGLEPLLIDLDSELRAFPAPFAYTVAGPVDRDRVLALCHKLLAERPIIGASADVKLHRVIEVLKANLVKPWLDQMAAQLETFEAAEKFLATAPTAAKIKQDRDEAESDLAEAEAAVTAAERRRDEIKKQLALLAGKAERRRDAEKVTSATNPGLLGAVAHLKQLRAAQAAE